MKIVYESNPKHKITFSQVDVGQFFVMKGMLFQKFGEKDANQIADSNGVPYCGRWEFEEGDEIKKIIGKPFVFLFEVIESLCGVMAMAFMKDCPRNEFKD